jgi:KaiC/GvpD/RAD55 family RecA-like ATPase
MARVPSGIPGLDRFIGNGFVQGSMNLITGKTGTGKSIFCGQFIYKGATEYNEPGIYITTEQTANELRGDFKESFGWDFTMLERMGKVAILEVKPYEIRPLINVLESVITKIGARRAVIDSETVFGLYLKDKYVARKEMWEIMNILKEYGITTLITAQVLEESEGLSRFGVIEFMVDSVIILRYMALAEKFKRNLTIRKMRRTKHSEEIHPIIITDKGIVVYSPSEVLK